MVRVPALLECACHIKWEGVTSRHFSKIETHWSKMGKKKEIKWAKSRNSHVRWELGEIILFYRTYVKMTNMVITSLLLALYLYY